MESGAPSGWGYLYYMTKMRWIPPEDVTTRLGGKTVIVTGANTGLGYAAALKYAQLGAARLVLGVRDAEKGKKAKEAIISQIRDGEENTNIHVWEIDMNMYSSIKTFASRIEQELDRVDIVLLNAGIQATAFHLSPEGWDEQFQVNTISTALLALLLLPKLRRSGTLAEPAHLSFVASQGHQDAIIPPDLQSTSRKLHKMNTPDGWQWRDRYTLSKLFSMWFTRALAKRLVKEDGHPQVVVNEMCPSLVATDIGRRFDGMLQTVLQLLAFVFGRTPEEGARLLVGTSLQPAESHGKFFQWYLDADTFPPSGYFTSDIGKKAQEDMWNEMIEILADKVSEVRSVVDSLPG